MFILIKKFLLLIKWQTKDKYMYFYIKFIRIIFYYTTIKDYSTMFMDKHYNKNIRLKGEYL